MDQDQGTIFNADGYYSDPRLKRLARNPSPAEVLLPRLMSTLDASPLYSSTVLEEFPVDVSMFANTLSDINFLFHIEALLTTKEAVWA